MAKPMCSMHGMRRDPRVRVSATRLMVTGVCLALITVLAWVAAPALSLRPYIPGGVDFERGIGSAKRIGPAAAAPARAAHPHQTAPRSISPPLEATAHLD